MHIYGTTSDEEGPAGRLSRRLKHSLDPTKKGFVLKRRVWEEVGGGMPQYFCKLGFIQVCTVLLAINQLQRQIKNQRARRRASVQQIRSSGARSMDEKRQYYRHQLFALRSSYHLLRHCFLQRRFFCCDDNDDDDSSHFQNSPVEEEHFFELQFSGDTVNFENCVVHMFTWSTSGAEKNLHSEEKNAFGSSPPLRSNTCSKAY